MQASQQYVSSRVSWFTGGFFGNLFQVEPEYGVHQHPCRIVLCEALFAHGSSASRLTATPSAYHGSDGLLLAVRRKLVLLLAPFLHRYDYMRQAENMATAIPTMKPPRDDLFAPDLYIPLHAVFTYVVLSACNRFIGGSFKPDVMYNMVRICLLLQCWFT